MGKHRRRLLERLQTARDEQQLVLLERTGDFDHLEGYVLDIGSEWLLLALRLDAITRVEVDGRYEQALLSVASQPSRNSELRSAETGRFELPMGCPKPH